MANSDRNGIRLTYVQTVQPLQTNRLIIAVPEALVLHFVVLVVDVVVDQLSFYHRSQSCIMVPEFSRLLLCSDFNRPFIWPVEMYSRRGRHAGSASQAQSKSHY